MRFDQIMFPADEESIPYLVREDSERDTSECSAETGNESSSESEDDAPDLESDSDMDTDAENDNMPDFESSDDDTLYDVNTPEQQKEPGSDSVSEEHHRSRRFKKTTEFYIEAMVLMSRELKEPMADEPTVEKEMRVEDA